jgi:hypothetical protein
MELFGDPLIVLEGVRLQDWHGFLLFSLLIPLKMSFPRKTNMSPYKLTFPLIFYPDQKCC